MQPTQGQGINNAQQFTNTAAWISADAVIQQVMADFEESNADNYLFYKKWLIKGYRELNFDVIENIKRQYLLIDPNTNQAKLPTDFVNYVNIGFVDECTQQIVPFGRDDLLVPCIQPSPTEFDCTCGCGCKDPVCNSLSHGKVTTTVNDVVINGTTYQQIIRICHNGKDSIIKETQTPTLNLATTYTWTIPSHEVGGYNQISIGINSNTYGKYYSSTPTMNDYLDFFNSLGLGTFTVSGTTVSVTSLVNTYNAIIIGGFPMVISISGASYPVTLNNIWINTQYYTLDTVCNSIADIAAALSTLGLGTFTLGSGGIIWDSLIYIGGINFTGTITVTFENGLGYFPISPATSNNVEIITTTEELCKAHLKPCGCVEVTSTMTDVLNTCNCCNWGTWNIWWWGYYSWWYIWNKWKQPLDKGFNQFGYYRVMPYEGYVIFSSNVNYLCCCASGNCGAPQSKQEQEQLQRQNNVCASVNFKNVVIEYYSNGNLEESNFQIPILFFDPLVNYIAWQKINRKLNIPQAEKARAQALYEGSKIAAQRRKEPIRINELLAVIRNNVNP